MRLGRELGVVFLAAMILAACAAPRGGQVEVDPALVEAEARKQRELYVRTKFEETVRVNRVGTPLLVAAARLCAGDVTPRFGFVAANKF